MIDACFRSRVGQWLIGAGLAPDRYLAAQGARVGRAGVISAT